MVGGGAQQNVAKANAMNSPTAKMHKKQRQAQIEKHGNVQQDQFFDERLAARSKQNEMYKINRKIGGIKEYYG